MQIKIKFNIGQKFNQLLLKRPKVVNIAILVLLVVLYLGLFMRPTIKGLFLVLPQASELKRNILNLEQDSRNLDTLKAKVLQSNKEIDSYEKRLPNEKEIPAILKYLSNAARKLDVRITEIKPIEQDEQLQAKAEMPSAIYYQAPILLKAECGYHQLGRFLSALERADRFMKIGDIKILTNTYESNFLDIELIVVTYVMKR